MKIRYIAIAALFCFLAVSCVTKPKPPVEPPVDTTQPGPDATKPVDSTPAGTAPADLDALAEKAAAVRKKAFDLKLFEVLPDDYRAADESYGTAKAAYDAKNSAEAETGFRKSTGMFEDVIARGITILEQEKKARAVEMKTAAVKEGALENAPQWYGDAENAFADAEALAASGDHEGAIAAYENARLLYELAQKRTRAASLKSRIDEKELSSFDSGNYAIATEKLQFADSSYSTDPEAALDALDEAILRYNLVVQKGYENYAASRKEPADDSKNKADEIKAPVAVKADYEAAQAVYDEANAAMAAGRYEEAAASYDQAQSLFEKAWETATVKKEAATKALDSLEETTAVSEQKIKEADEALSQSEQGGAE
ncbi:MAG: hypothetical protein NT080_06520 [Spirochaetes bacterium]|nr:hypothetical protein [Spirochaetota bacterium]